MTDSLLSPGTQFEFWGSSAVMQGWCWLTEARPGPVLGSWSCPLSPPPPPWCQPDILLLSNENIAQLQALLLKCRRMGVWKSTLICTKSFAHPTEERKGGGLVVQREACLGRREREQSSKLLVLKHLSRPAPGWALRAKVGIMRNRPEGSSVVHATWRAALPELSSPWVPHALAQPRRMGTTGVPITAWVTKGDRQMECGGLLQWEGDICMTLHSGCHLDVLMKTRT